MQKTKSETESRYSTFMWGIFWAMVACLILSGMSKHPLSGVIYAFGDAFWLFGEGVLCTLNFAKGNKGWGWFWAIVGGMFILGAMFRAIPS